MQQDLQDSRTNPNGLELKESLMYTKLPQQDQQQIPDSNQGPSASLLSVPTTSNHSLSQNLIQNDQVSLISAASPSSNEISLDSIKTESTPKSRSISFQSWHQVPQVSLTWQNISYTAKKGTKQARDILFDITGYLPPGKMLAIIGPSGAGKTTLLRILSGCLVSTKGEIYYNGTIKPNTVTSTFSDDIMGYNGNAAFITQDLLLHGSLTVRETLYYAAQLKCKLMTQEALDERIDKLLEYLGLVHCQNTLIGNLFFKGISGGEKRRCAIGCELVTQMSLLFMDEPTSGLDATGAYALFNMCHGLTLLGHSIIMTVHQPSSRIFDMLSEWQDYLMILEHGRLMYFGLCHHSIEFFQQCNFSVPNYTNPFDFFLDIVNSDFLQSNSNSDIISTKFQQNLLPSVRKEINRINTTNPLIQSPSPSKSPNQRSKSNSNSYKQLSNYSRSVIIRPNGFLTQVKVLLKRNFLNHLRNPSMYLIRLIMYVTLCVCAGAFDFHIGDTDADMPDRVTIIFIVEAFLTLMSVSAMPTFIEERHIFIRERVNGHYRTLGYSIANFLSSLPWLFAMAFLSSIVIYFMIQSRPGINHFCIYCMNLFICLIVSESMMVTISAVSPVFMVGLAVGAGTLGIYMMVSGFLAPKNIPIPFMPLHYISFHTYTFQNFMYDEFHGLKVSPDNYIYKTGDDVLKIYNMENVNIGVNFAVLIIMIVVYQMMFYFFLRFKNKVTK